MAEIEDAIERADWESFTRQPPKTLQARINFLMKQLKTTKAVAQEIGVSQRSVERYRKGERKHPRRPSPNGSTLPYGSGGSPRSANADSNKPPPPAGSPWKPGPGSATPHPSAPPTTDASDASPSTSPDLRTTPVQRP